MRRYREDDEAAVVALLRSAFGTWPVVEGAAAPDPFAFFRWKHLAGPHGPSRMVVAEHAGRIVGFRGFMPWRLQAGGRSIRALRGVDAATSPELQHRGVFGRLRRTADALYSEPPELYFSTSNEASAGAAMKLGGHSIVGVLHTRVLTRPVLTARELAHHQPHGGKAGTGGDPASAVLGPRDAELDALLAESRAGERRLTTAKDAAWLRWRYAHAPLDYRVLAHERGNRFDGLAIFRFRVRRGLTEAVVEELFVRPGDTRSARRLLGAVIRYAQVPLASCEFPADTPAGTAAAQLGFVPWRGGLRLMVSVVRPGVVPTPERLESWALSLGELELV